MQQFYYACQTLRKCAEQNDLTGNVSITARTIESRSVVIFKRNFLLEL